MAEIHVEPKKQSSGASWIWIVLVLLIAAAVVYYLMTRNNRTDNAVTPANTTGAIYSMPAPLTTLHHNTVVYC